MENLRLVCLLRTIGRERHFHVQFHGISIVSSSVFVCVTCSDAGFSLLFLLFFYCAGYCFHLYEPRIKAIGEDLPCPRSGCRQERDAPYGVRQGDVSEPAFLISSAPSSSLWMRGCLLISIWKAGSCMRTDLEASPFWANYIFSTTYYLKVIIS